VSVRKAERRTPAVNRRSPASRSARSHVLDVRVRRSTARRQRNHRVMRTVLYVTLWVGLAVATWIGFNAVTKKFFLENPTYDLRTVDADLDGLMSHEEALEMTGIELGKNIFKIDLAAAEKALRGIEQVATVAIRRDWPDRISLKVTRRVPVAWLARAGDGAFNADHAWLLDAAGSPMKAFRVDPEYWRLPVIYAPNPQAIRDGDALACADLRAALDILAENSRRPGSLLELRSIDISKGYAFLATDANNASITFAPTDPAGQLDRLETLLENCRATGRTIESVNLIPKKYIPVRFLLASSNEPAVEEPNPEAER
jgi:Cell division septal protein